MPSTPPPHGSSVVPLALTPDDAPTVIRPPPETPAAGQRVGQYEILGVAGAGGMAEVLRARDVDLGREVALKMLPPAQVNDAEAVARFKLEGRAAAQLDHDNVARVFACGEDAGRHYIAFEFVEGETLRDAIARRGPLPPGECAAITCEVAAGLAHAAERGVVHRDIKPSNLILTPAGRVKIVDMGLARSGRPIDGDVTKSGVTLGTFDYISPEQALDPRRADARSDIYSLGCTIYHAATGRPPVPPGTAAQKLRAHQHDPVVDPRVLNPAVPLGLAQLLAGMMAKNPAKRFQTPRELLAAAARLAAELGVATDSLPADARGSQIIAVPPSPGRGGLLAGLAAAAVAVAVAIGLLAPTRPGPTAPPWEAPARPQVEPPAVGERPKPPAPGPVSVATVEELVKEFGRAEVTAVRLTGKTYDLTGLADGVLVGGRPSLTLEAADGAMPTLKLAVAPPAEFERWQRPRPGTLTVAGVAHVVIRGLRLELADGPAGDGVDRPAGLAVADADSLAVENCRVEATTAPPDALGIVVSRTDGSCTAAVRRTLFGKRVGTGLAFAGPVKATLTGCGFASPQAGVRLAGAGGTLVLSGCKFLLDRGAAVELEADAGWPVEAAGCVFAAAPADPATATAVMMGEGPPRPAVVRAAAGWPAGARFQGRPAEPNTFHGTDALAVDGPAVSLAAARRDDRFQDAGDDRKAPPWAGRDPLADLDTADPWRAFRVGPPAAEPGGRVRVWWPDARESEPVRGTFTRFEEAVRALKPGDELQVRHDGELAVPPVVWKGGKLTVKPHPGSMPILRPTGEAVVRLLDGEVTLDGLTVRITRPAAAVLAGGGRRVSLRGCTVTVADPGAVAVRLTGDAGVTLADTLVRGRGGVVAAGERPAEVTLTHSWAAVAGPLLRADGEARLTLTRVTAVCGGPAFAPGGRLAVTADRCLFAPVGGRLRLDLDGVEWTAAGPNWFADPGFSTGGFGPMATAAVVTFHSPPAADELGAVERADLVSDAVGIGAEEDRSPKR